MSRASATGAREPLRVAVLYDLCPRRPVHGLGLSVRCFSVPSVCQSIMSLPPRVVWGDGEGPPPASGYSYAAAPAIAVRPPIHPAAFSATSWAVRGARKSSVTLASIANTPLALDTETRWFPSRT